MKPLEAGSYPAESQRREGPGLEREKEWRRARDFGSPVGRVGVVGSVRVDVFRLRASGDIKVALPVPGHRQLHQKGAEPDNQKSPVQRAHFTHDTPSGEVSHVHERPSSQTPNLSR